MTYHYLIIMVIQAWEGDTYWKGLMENFKDYIWFEKWDCV